MFMLIAMVTKIYSICVLVLKSLTLSLPVN